MSRVDLGDKAKDVITGFTGIVTGRFEFLHGCVRCQLSGKSKDGEPSDHTFDEPQLKVLERKKIPPAKTPVHGDRPNPSRTGL